jgi:hypothetical protein
MRFVLFSIPRKIRKKGMVQAPCPFIIPTVVRVLSEGYAKAWKIRREIGMYWEGERRGECN